MAKIPTTPQAREVQIRPGVDPLADANWGGVNTEDDPISLRLNELQRGQNVRRSGKHLTNRPGLVPKIDLSSCAGYPPGAVMLLTEAPVVASPLNLWVSCVGAADRAPQTGASILVVESTASPAAKPYARITASTYRRVPIASYGSKLIAGDGSVLRELIRVLVFPAGDQAQRIPALPSVPLDTASGWVITCLLEFSGKLFVGYQNVADPSVGKIAVWDGVEMKDDLTTVNAPSALGIWQDKLVASFYAGYIRVRDAGVTVPGTWTNYTIAGFTSSLFGNAMAEYRQYLYIAGGGDKIYRFDGAAVVVANTIPDCYNIDYSSTLGVTGLVLHKGVLYYCWNGDPDAVNSSFLGRHDLDSTATPWTDQYKPLTAEIPNFLMATAIASYRGQLYIAGRNRWLIATHHSDILSDLEVLHDTGPQYGDLQLFPTQQLLRF